MDFITTLVDDFQKMHDYSPTAAWVWLLLIALTAMWVIPLVFAIFADVYCWLDTRKLPTTRRDASVTGKEFVPEHTQTLMIYNAATKTSLPHFIHHPDRWYVYVAVDDVRECIQVGKKFYEAVSKGDETAVYTVIGRFTKRMSIVDFAPSVA